MPIANASKPQVISVSQLNRATDRLLGEHFSTVWVEGEISNLSMPSSGHWYFSLKDANAQVRCALFKNQQYRGMARPENGKQVVVKATVGLYEPRGDFQLIAEDIEEAGDGALRRAFEALKRKLAEEGLFDAAAKQVLPVLPGTVGVITSPTGAAVRDILTVLKRRFPAASVIIYPVAVQGENAKFEIVRAIAKANAEPLCDVLIIGRGGGSLEDLWAFNEEMVARAIFASEVPTISAVGHETDFTIADFVADVRAATPSAAAEHAVPDQQQWLARALNLEARLQQVISRKISGHRQTLTWLLKRLQPQHPGQKLRRNAQRLDELELRLKQAVQGKLRHQQAHLGAISATLSTHNPAIQINRYQQQQDYLQQRLQKAISHKLARLRQHTAALGQTLQVVSPLATLNRGYALAIKPATGEIIRSIEQVKIADMLTIRLGRGAVSAQVSAVDRME